MTDTDDVLKANDAFYTAFTACSVSDMDKVWARSGPVSCIHPGWDPILDRANIMLSWGSIFSYPSSPKITHQDPQVQFVQDKFALVINKELVDGKPELVATNIYLLDPGAGQRWVMIHHQSGK